MTEKSNEYSLVLHQFPRSQAPNPSPFALKLETWMRMNNLLYTVDTKAPYSKTTKKCPWIEYNGVPVTDSQLCIEHIANERGIDIDSNLSEEQKATAHTIRKMAEENLYWCVMSVLFDEQPEYLRPMLPYTGLMYNTILFVVRRKMKKSLYSQGMGRLSYDRVLELGKADVHAISTMLGEKSYMMGDTPSVVDCAVFAMLAVIFYQTPDSRLHQFIKNDHSKLEAYVERMKEAYWPDWEEVTNKPKDTSANTKDSAAKDCATNAKDSAANANDSAVKDSPESPKDSAANANDSAIKDSPESPKDSAANPEESAATPAT